MKIFRILLYSVLSAFLPLCLQAQTLKIGSDNNPNQYLILSKDTVYLNYNDFTSVGIARERLPSAVERVRSPVLGATL